MGRTVQMVTDTPLVGGAGDLLTALESLWLRWGWTVLQRLVYATGVTSDKIKTDLSRQKPDHTLFIGDAIPWIIEQAAPEGHFLHDVPKDYRYVQAWNGASGRVRFDNMGLTNKTSMELYRNWLTKRLRFETDCMNFGMAVEVIDYLAYRPDLEPPIQTTRTQIPWGLLRNMGSGGELAADGSGSDYNFESWSRAEFAVLMALMFSGGMGDGTEGSILAGGLYYLGGPAEWKKWDPRVLMPIVFGSMESDVQTQNAFPLFMLTGSYSVCSFYDYFGYLPVWQMFTQNATAGDIGRATTSEGLCVVFGDPTTQFSTDFLALAKAKAQAEQIVDATKRLAALEARVK